MLSCDGLSSAAYGTEEILRALLPFFGLAAFSLVLPMTLVVLASVGGLQDYERPVPPSSADPIGSLHQPGRVTVQGRLHAAKVRPMKHDSNVLACEVADSTGELTAVFYGRARIAGLEPGRQVRLRGMVGIGDDGRPSMINPGYELLG